MSKTSKTAPVAIVAPNPDGSWLPMPFEPGPGGPKFTITEYREYQDRQRRHLEANPAYGVGWRRPIAHTAAMIWSLIAEPLGIQLETLLPSQQVRDAMSPTEYTTAVQTIKAAFVVAYDAAVFAAERRSMVTANLVFDAVAALWSDNYRKIRETTPATCSWDMRKKTVEASWRDLHRNAIQFGALYKVLHAQADSKSPLDRGVYRARRAETRGYTVRITNAHALAEYLTILAADPSYRRRRHGHRLLLGEDHSAPARSAGSVAAERRYNVASPGPKSIEIIQHLEAARVSLHVPTVLQEIAEIQATVANLADQLRQNYSVDVETLPRPHPRSPEAVQPGRTQKLWHLHRRLRAVPAPSLPGAKALLVRYDRARAQLDGFADVRDRLRALTNAEGRVLEDGHVAIRSRFRKELNRRYQAVDFWPAEITGKAFQRDLLAEADPAGTATDADGRRWTGFSRPALYTVTSRRARWFSVPATGLEDLYAEFDDGWTGERRPLVGVDVSTSQVQVLAVFLGLKDLEADLRKQPFKDGLVGRVICRHVDAADPFKLPDAWFAGAGSECLKGALKYAVMTRLYGSGLKSIARNLESDPDEFGPGLGSANNIRFIRESCG
jgi:hypothetical protein